MITQDQIVGLTKQVFMLEYLINGLFPCQSDVVRLIRAKKREWKFNNKFEYRMLLAVTNTSGSLNTSIFQDNVSLNYAGSLDYGIFSATYGQVADGFNIDMMRNLETKEQVAAFENDYATRMHSLRTNVASSFKNFAIHGQMGVIHQINAGISYPALDGGVTGGPYNVKENVLGAAPTPNVPFTIKVPNNVYQSNFKRGRLVIKTKDTSGTGVNGPWGPASVAELYCILENQPGYLTLVLISGAGTGSVWYNGEYLEVHGNREIADGTKPFQNTANWGTATLSTAGGAGAAFDGLMIPQWLYTGSSAYTSGNPNGAVGSESAPVGASGAVVGAMEGLADLFPWYATLDSTGAAVSRVGLGRPFRGQPNRMQYSTEQAGGFVIQQPGENIIDVIMRGSMLTKSTVPYAEVGVWINPITRTQMGYEEGDNVRVLRDNFVQGPIVWQRGTKTTDYQIGNQVVREVVEDLNMPTDVIVIGPKDDMSYNCWDNTIFQIDEYIQALWAKTPPKRVEDIEIPDELLTRMDLTNRIIYGSPSMGDAAMLTDWTYNSSINGGTANIRHPRNSLPVAMLEAGALFTEYPYTYTVCKLRNPITDLRTV